MKFVILGCGSSMGVPRPDGYFGNCDSKNKKNYRTRCSALIKTDVENVLIDTSPDLRNQMLIQKITKIDKVFYSHMHADQTHGINDLRSFFIRNKKPIDVFADNITSKYLKKTFSYCFDTYSREYPATLKLNNIDENLFIKAKKKKILIKPIKVQHGNVQSICYIVGKKLAYISDVSEIFEKDYKHFKNLKYLIIDCLWYRNHPSHFNFEKSLEMIKKFLPQKAILTNLHTDIDYDQVKKKLPKNIVPAYDGLSVIL
jgi:phosphoribosyl 1,2-cyclic phosphate phosphodiesterase